ncbi:hypothetical protein TGVAND_286000 [Toxoplasma gondii VAND]|uniref:Uncharacterized protein n=1 Tax=Toxoplasma gondii VAND TaxID=933077 RepID=A0A086Q6Z9_TOXGO|nr:hypothetical protein TGVAND_286000 [Toxoplasma gondii VAND]
MESASTFRSRQCGLVSKGVAWRAVSLTLRPLILIFSLSAPLLVVRIPAVSTPPSFLTASLPFAAPAEAMVADVLRRAKDAVGHRWRNGSRLIADQFGVSHSYLKFILPQYDPAAFEQYKVLASQYAELTQEVRDAAGTKDFEEISSRNAREQESLLEEVDRLLEHALGPSLRPRLVRNRSSRRVSRSSKNRESPGAFSSARGHHETRPDRSRGFSWTDERAHTARHGEKDLSREGETPFPDRETLGANLTVAQRHEWASLHQRLNILSHQQRLLASAPEAALLEATKQDLMQRLFQLDASIRRQRLQAQTGFSRAESVNQVMEEMRRRGQHVAARMAEAEMVVEESEKALGVVQTLLSQLQAVPGRAAQAREGIRAKREELEQAAAAATHACVFDAFVLSGGLDAEVHNVAVSTRSQGAEILGRFRTALSKFAAGIRNLEALMREAGVFQEPALQRRIEAYVQRMHALNLQGAQIHAAAEPIVRVMETEQLQVETEAAKLQQVVGSVSESCVAFLKKEETRLQVVSSKVMDRVSPVLASLQSILERAVALGQKQDKKLQSSQHYPNSSASSSANTPSTPGPPASSGETDEADVDFQAKALQKELEPIVADVSHLTEEVRNAERQISTLTSAAVALSSSPEATAVAASIAGVKGRLTKAEQSLVAALSQTQAQVSVAVSKARRHRQDDAFRGAYLQIVPWPGVATGLASTPLKEGGLRSQGNVDSVPRQSSARPGYH